MPRREDPGAPDAPADAPDAPADAVAPPDDLPAHEAAELDGGGEGPLTNGDLARIFHEIGDMLEIKGELVFKTVAYHRAADTIGRSPVDLIAAYQAGTPPRIPGVGPAISDKIAELATTGRLAFYERLAAEVPPGLVDLLRLPGLGPKTVRTIHAQLGIDSMEGLRHRGRERRAARREGPLGQDRATRPRGHPAPGVAARSVCSCTRPATTSRA